MRFEEPHLNGAAPYRAREVVNFAPFLEGLRYMKRDARLLATVCVKAGIGVMGANNVILPILGAREFAPHLGGLDPQRAGMLGMSILMGARGVGALLGPLMSARWGGNNRRRLRLGIVFGFLAAAGGYVGLGTSPFLWLACVGVAVSHMGGSTNWVFSTTLLQFQTDDRFRGRVFSADMGLCVLTIAISSYVAGVAIDYGTPARVTSVWTGLAMLVPATAWGLALRLWKKPEASGGHS